MPNDSTAARPAATRMHHLSGCEKFAIFPMEWMPHIKTSRELRVFLTLIAHVDRQGCCFPSLEIIARMTDVDERDVRRTLRMLEKIGAIQTERGQGHCASRYRVMLPPANGAPSHTKRVAAERGVEHPPLPHQQQGGKTPPSEEVKTPPSDRAESPPLSNHVTVHRTSSSRARARAKASKQAKTDEQENVRTNDGSPTASLLREPTDDEARVLAVCYQWQRGISRPMPADLVELYRTMRPVHDLPRRPGA